MKKIIPSLFLLFSLLSAYQSRLYAQIEIKLEPDERVWTGMIVDGHLMPFDSTYKIDFTDNGLNQLQPLVLTNKGRYIWSEEPFNFEYTDNKILINDPNKSVVTAIEGSTLREARKYVSDTYFPPSGLMPDSLLFSAPQYNTWIELNRHQNQKEILEYARAIIDNGLPPGVFMIDDTWQEDYGVWDFHPGRFESPKEMIDTLHQLGFKVMLWICPFVSPDQTLLYKSLHKQRALLLDKKSENDTWESADKPAIIEWWDGYSAELDFSNPAAVDWFNAQLERLTNTYNIDGFKFDAGDFSFYPENTLSMGNLSPNEHCFSYAQFGLSYPLNEYRACWKMAGQPLGQRLLDKSQNWEDLQKLIPHMNLEALIGYTFSCPDMIGGGLLTTFSEDGNVNQEILVRSAQCHALMPMMQFSVAPWRVLDDEHMGAVRKAVQIREKFKELILAYATESAKTGEPIMANLEYYFPNKGYAEVNDQFMLGPELLVAPMVSPGIERKVILPAGNWIADDGKRYKGNTEINIEVPLDRLAYFKLVK